MTDTWNFDEDLGGTFALDKIASDENPDDAIEDIED